MLVRAQNLRTGYGATKITCIRKNFNLEQKRFCEITDNCSEFFNCEWAYSLVRKGLQ
jgi:hypothetical protein